MSDDASNIQQRTTYYNSSPQVTPHDAMNRMIRRDVTVAGAVTSQEYYGYDELGRMLSLDRIEDGLTRRDAFGYNAAGELTSAKYDLVNNLNPSRSVTYALDSVGNRTSVNENGVATAYVPDDINRYTSVGGFSVGTGGAHQMISYQGESYAYIGDTYIARMTSGDGHNLLLGYDALGRCVQRNLDGAITYYLYDGEKPIQEVGATVASNLYGAGIDEIVERDVPGNVYYFFQDHEGSVTHVADLSGLTERYRYDAFGAPTVKGPFGAVRSGSAIGNRFMFTGREYDEDFNLYEWSELGSRDIDGCAGMGNLRKERERVSQYRARAYSPYSGRFMTEDPKGFAAGDYNLFRYCKNDPLDLTDPMGLTQNGAQSTLPWDQIHTDTSFDHSRDDAEKAKPVLVKDVNIKLTGSNIPYRVRVYNSGNWNDRKIENHASSNLEAVTKRAGLTLPKGASSVAGSNVDIYMRVDWYYDKKYSDTNVITRELQHVQDARNLEVKYSSNGASLQGLQNFGDVVKGFRINQQRIYDGAFGGDAPHDIIKHPALPAEIPEYEATSGP